MKDSKDKLFEYISDWFSKEDWIEINLYLEKRMARLAYLFIYRRYKKRLETDKVFSDLMEAFWWEYAN